MPLQADSMPAAHASVPVRCTRTVGAAHRAAPDTIARRSTRTVQSPPTVQSVRLCASAHGKGRRQPPPRPIPVCGAQRTSRSHSTMKPGEWPAPARDAAHPRPSTQRRRPSSCAGGASRANARRGSIGSPPCQSFPSRRGRIPKMTDLLLSNTPPFPFPERRAACSIPIDMWRPPKIKRHPHLALSPPRDLLRRLRARKRHASAGARTVAQDRSTPRSTPRCTMQARTAR